MGREEHVDDLAVLVDGAVRLSPDTVDLHQRLVDEPPPPDVDGRTLAAPAEARQGLERRGRPDTARWQDYIWPWARSCLPWLARSAEAGRRCAAVLNADSRSFGDEPA
ncbi:hypothetical protein [Dactylosporangium darangshiense]|uniref:Uncharacterized protein n=1 Tax=Dactylosporangium darangshiense TaxID=579108 RepID=A0ABP8DV44_9ACTN